MQHAVDTVRVLLQAAGCKLPARRMMSIIEDALDALRRGEIIGLPTDTVYGIAADPWDRSAVERLFAAKGRSGLKPIPILVADAEQAGSIAVLSEPAGRLAARHWPGGLTLVLRRVAGLAEWIGDPAQDTVGVRVPDHPAALALLETAGPLAVTSANRSGAVAAGDDRAARRLLGPAVSVYVPGGGGGAASTVVDFTSNVPEVLRPGPVDVEVP